MRPDTALSQSKLALWYAFDKCHELYQMNPAISSPALLFSYLPFYYFTMSIAGTPNNSYINTHSNSPGEPSTPSFGDVRTIICDVSPVPSDVESIDYARISKTASERRGLFSVGRSQQTLRIGRNLTITTSSNLLCKNHCRNS